MSSDSLLTLLTVFVAVAAVALLVQAAMLVGLFVAARKMQQQVSAFTPQIQGVLSTAQATLASAQATLASAEETITQTRQQVLAATTKANNVMDMAKVQMEKVDVLLSDATSRAKVQMEKVELAVDDTVSRVHESVSLVHNGIVKPLREINGITTGIRAAFQHLLTGRRPSVDQATQDEEMFI